MVKTLPLLVIAVVGFALLLPTTSHAIQGCTLRDPDRDVRRLFPEATDYRTHLISIRQRDPALLSVLEKRLGDKLDAVYEDAALPYAYYEILQKQKVIGYVFGVNQKGRFGGMQLILAADPDGKIRDFYYQKISSPHRRELMASAFTDRFKGLELSDFYYHQGYQRLGLKRPEDRVAKITSPVLTDEARADTRSTLRGVKKGLILFDLFWNKDQGRRVFEEVERIVRTAQQKTANEGEQTKRSKKKGSEK